MEELTQAELKLKINYYEKSGALTWAEDGEHPETVISEHFTVIAVKDKELTRRRLIFFWMTGELIKDCKIEHTNGDRNDNRWANLKKIIKEK
jgi:hypothetical protein